MEKTIVERRKHWIDHLIINNTWITTIIEGKTDGKPGRGRPRQLYTKQIMMDIGKESYRESRFGKRRVEKYFIMQPIYRLKKKTIQEKQL